VAGQAEQVATGTPVRLVTAGLAGRADASIVGDVIIGEEIIRVAKQRIIRSLTADTQTITRDTDEEQTVVRTLNADSQTFTRSVDADAQTIEQKLTGEDQELDL
jgi:hypothetical protein